MAARRKTSKYFADKQKPKDEEEQVEVLGKRKSQADAKDVQKPPPSKKLHKTEEENDDDFVFPQAKRSINADATPSKKLKSAPGQRVSKKLVDAEGSDEEDVGDTKSPIKAGGRGRGGRGASTAAVGRGRGSGGRGGFMNFGERKDPPHKGEKVEGLTGIFSAHIYIK